MTNKTARWLLCVVLVFVMAASLALAACEQQSTATFAGGQDATGDAPQAITVNTGDVITLPANTFSRQGYDFAGWSDGSKVYQPGDEYTLAQDVTFTAQWTEKQVTPPAPAEYTLSFGLGAHAASGAVAPQSKKLQEGATYALPAAPAAAEGWEFAGWGESKLQAGATYTMPAEDTELVAQWTEQQVTPPAPAEYTLSFGLGEHAASGAVAPQSKKLQEGATYALPDAPAAAEGWEFAGWGESKLQAGATFTMPAEDTELVAQWTEKQVTPPAEQVTVTFKVGGDVFTTQTINKGALATKPAQDPTDPNGEKTFRYWTDDEGTEFLFTTPVTQDITLNAKFAICVTFDLDGGTGTQPAPVWEESYSPRGITVTMPAAEGYSKGEQVLTGWSDGENTYKPGAEATITSSVTLTAVWGEAQTEPTKYSVEYYRGVTSDTGFSGQAPEGAGEYTVGEQITLPACTWTRIGYNFAGWKVRRWVENLEYSEGGYWENMPDVEILQPEGKYTMPSEKIQISAQWTAATVTVVYDSNGGSGSMANGSFVFEKSLTPAENGFTAPEGKVFGGWALEATAQEAAELTPLGALAKATYLSYVKLVGSDWTLTLYAIWNEAPAPSIDFAELCGVWTNDTKTIILLSEGEDSYEGTVGSAIVNGNAFYKLVKYDNLLIDSETYGELCSITINSETSITCDGTTYTAKADVKNGTVADLAGTWNFGLSSKLTITSLGKATISQNGSDTSSTLLYVDKYVVVFYTKSHQLTSYVLTLNETKDKLIGYSRISEGSPKSIEFTKDSTPPIEGKTLKYVGEAQNVYGSMTVIFKSIEMIEGDDTYAKLTYTVDGTEHVDELKNDETNKTFMKQGTTASWPGTSAYTVIKFWKMYPLANPPYTKNSNASYPGTSYSVGLTGDGTKLVIALSTGDVGVLTLEGSEELPPEELPIFTGTATFESKGFLTSGTTFTITQIEIDPTVLTTEAYITYSTAAQESKRVAVTLTDNSNSKSNYKGEGEPKFYYSMYLSSESGPTAFYLAVIDDNTVVLCDSDDTPLGTFTTGGGTVTPEQKFDVTYSAGEHGSELALPESEQYAEGNSVTVGFGLDNVTEGDAHYAFAGWSDGKGHTYQPGEQFDMPAEAVTLTAQWESFTPTTKTINDYLGVWEGEAFSDTEIVKITINSDGISFGTKDYPNEPTALENITEIKDGKYLVVTAQRVRTLGPSKTVVFTLVITFTEDNKATMEIDGATAEFTRTSTIQPSEPEEKPQKPEDADGKYTNPAGTPELVERMFDNDEYNFTEAELTGNKLHLVSSYPIDVDLTWDGNEATGYWERPYSLTVIATEGQLEITFHYGSDAFKAVFTKVSMHDVTATFESGEESDVTGDAPEAIVVQAADGEKASVQMPNAGTLAREGFTFDGWTIKNGDGTVYKTGSSVEIESDTVFVPSWKEQSQGGATTYTQLSDFVGSASDASVSYGYESKEAAESAAQTLVDTASLNKTYWKFEFYMGKQAGVTCLMVKVSYDDNKTLTGPIYLPSDLSTKITSLYGLGIDSDYIYKSSSTQIHIRFSQNDKGQRQITLSIDDTSVTWLAVGDEPQTGGDSAAVKLNDFAGASSAEPVVYGFESADAAGENGLVVSSTTTLFKIEFYYIESGFTIKRYWNATNSSVAQVKDESYSSTITDQNAANQTVTFKVAGQTLKFTFGTNDQGKRTVTMQVETSTGSGTYGAPVTWTEIAA